VVIPETLIFAMTGAAEAFATVTAIEVEVAVLLLLSVAKA
jgi:hypothetical protein